MQSDSLDFSESVSMRVKALGFPYILQVIYKSVRVGFVAALLIALIEMRLLQGPELTGRNVARFAALAFVGFFSIRIFMDTLWRSIAIGKHGVHISHAGWWELNLNAKMIISYRVENVHGYTVLHLEYNKRKCKNISLVFSPTTDEMQESIESFFQELAAKNHIPDH